MGAALLNTYLQTFDSPTAKNTPHWRPLFDVLVIVINSQDNRPETWLKMAINQAKQLEMAQDLLQVMHICSAVVLSFLDPRFGPPTPMVCLEKDF